MAAIVQCSGNRREDQNSVAQVEGLTWYTGAISCAEWEGVALKDVLEYAPRVLLGHNNVQRV